MKKHIKRALKHPLISGSSIIFVGSFIANILNYFFNLSMGRLLSVSDYGLLISLTALVVLLTILQSSLTMLFAKFAARYSAKNDHSAKAHLIWSGTKITVVVSFIFLALLTVLIIPLSEFLHVNNSILMIVVFLSVAISILGSLPFGILQGSLQFLQTSIISIIGASAKILLGVFFVLAGFGVVGGALGILFAFLIPYVISYTYVIRKYGITINSKSKLDFFDEFKKISGPFLMASVAITILSGTDVIFARHFLDSEEAGLFAALSLMGKAIFYITSPIYFAFFPIIAHKKEKKENTSGTLFLALGIVLATSLAFTSIYSIFPHLIIKIFFPIPAYQELASYLGLYSVYVTIFSLVYLMYNYFLSIGRIGVYKLNWIAAFLYIILLTFFHSSITDFILSLTVSSFLLLLLLLVYYKRNAPN